MEMLPSVIGNKMFVWGLIQRNENQASTQAMRLKAMLGHNNTSQRNVTPKITKAAEEIDLPAIKKHPDFKETMEKFVKALPESKDSSPS